MNLRRPLLHALLAAPLLLAGPRLHAADFPTKPLTLVVPFAPGGPTDAMARVLAAALKGPLGQTVIVDNKAGAGGNIGAEWVARAPADGYTMLFGTSGPLAINQFLYPKMAYDPLRSFAPVIEIGDLPNVLVVNPSVPARTVQELVALAEQGVKDMNVSVFFGIVVPAATPPDVVARLNAAYVRVLADPEVRGKLAAQGLEPPAATTPAHLTEYMRQEAARWQDVVKASGARLD